MNENNHTITLIGREKLFVTGVDDVDSFDENCVVMRTPLGVLSIDGSELHIIRFGASGTNSEFVGDRIAEYADLILEGHIGGVFYIDDSSEKKKHFFRRSAG